MRLFFQPRKDDEAFYNFFKNVLGFCPRNIEVYRTAFIHRSKTKEIGSGHQVNNERLEYLGDAVLGAIVAEYLYKMYPYEGEGFLTITRSKIVSRASLGKLARKIGLMELIEFNRQQHGIFKSMEGDVFEALIGAIYLEKGYNFTRKVVINRLLKMYVDIDEMVNTDWNYKGMLLDWGQHNGRHINFERVKVTMREHSNRREYECRVCIDGVPAESAIAYNIKDAEQLAAEKCYKRLQEEQSKETKQTATLVVQEGANKSDVAESQLINAVEQDVKEAELIKETEQDVAEVIPYIIDEER